MLCHVDVGFVRVDLNRSLAYLARGRSYRFQDGKNKLLMTVDEQPNSVIAT